MQPVEEHVDKRIDDIQLVRKSLKRISLVCDGQEGIRLRSFPDEVIKELIVFLVIKEDCSSMVLYDRPSIGEGCMTIAHLRVIM